MKNYSVLVTDNALQDMQALYDYIAETLFAPNAALDQYNRIADAIESLSCFPERHRLSESEPERSQGIRFLPVDHYAVIYIVQDNAVTVLRVLYSASDIIDRLRSDK